MCLILLNIAHQLRCRSLLADSMRRLARRLGPVALLSRHELDSGTLEKVCTFSFDEPEPLGTSPAARNHASLLYQGKQMASSKCAQRTGAPA